MQLCSSKIESRFPSYYKPLRLNRNISGNADLMETADRALRKGKVCVYSELLAAAVVQAQPKLRAFVAAGAILLIRRLVLLSIRVLFCLSGVQHFLTGVSLLVAGSVRKRVNFSRAKMSLFLVDQYYSPFFP